jgi:hypothetical protein
MYCTSVRLQSEFIVVLVVWFFHATAVGVYCCTGSVVVSVVSVHTVCLRQCLRQWVQTLSSGNRDVKGPAPSFHTKPHAIDYIPFSTVELLRHTASDANANYIYVIVQTVSGGTIV